MKCYRVMVHGSISYQLTSFIPTDIALEEKPSGFYATRYVLANDTDNAIDIAIRKVKENFVRRFPESDIGLITVKLEAEEVSQSSYWSIFRPINRGYSFYIGKGESH